MPGDPVNKAQRSKGATTAQVLSLLLLCESGQDTGFTACDVLNTVCFLHWKEFNSQGLMQILKERKVSRPVSFYHST